MLVDFAGVARRGRFGRDGAAWQARRGLAESWHGMARRVMVWQAGHGRFGVARVGWAGAVRRGEALFGEAWHGMAGWARHVVVRSGWARRGGGGIGYLLINQKK